MTTSSYFVRFGSSRHVGRFAYEGDDGLAFGDVVVVRSRRGEELGEVIAPAEAGSGELTPLLRRASSEDCDRARRAQADRDRRLSEIEKVFGDGRWPIDLIDVEPLMEEDRTVLQYLGPHGLDTSGLWRAIRDLCGLDVVLEPVGIDAADDEPEEAADHEGCGSCGSGGGCGTGCGSEAGGGCSGCSVKDLVRASRPAAVAAS